MEYTDYYFCSFKLIQGPRLIGGEKLKLILFVDNSSYGLE